MGLHTHSVCCNACINERLCMDMHGLLLQAQDSDGCLARMGGASATVIQRRSWNQVLGAEPVATAAHIIAEPVAGDDPQALTIP